MNDSLAQRFDHYNVLVEDLVLRGIEHPNCELKRSLAIAKGGDINDRLEFIKLLQGVANAHSDDERLIVIGADQREKKFFNLVNADDFDQARLSPIICKYLQPEPSYEVFKQTPQVENNTS